MGEARAATIGNLPEAKFAGMLLLMITANYAGESMAPVGPIGAAETCECAHAPGLFGRIRSDPMELQ